MNKMLPFLLFAFFGVSEAHEDHSSRHGGFVMMFLDLHLELVMPEEGGVEIFYSDDMRRDMPASVVSEVAVALHRPDGSQEPLEMNVSDQGDRWAGLSGPISDPKTIVRVEFFWQGQPVTLEVPASVMPRFARDTGMKNMGLSAD